MWLVFDELDQRIAFSERPESLRLPELDRLREHSTYFENSFPPATCTDLSMPALMTGQWVIDAKEIRRDCLMLTLHDRPQPISLSELPSVFSQSAGFGAHDWNRRMGPSLLAIFPFVNRSFWNAVPFYDTARRRRAYPR